MKKLYSWHDVAERTEIVYDRALGCPNQNILDRLSRYASECYCLKLGSLWIVLIIGRHLN